MRRASGASKTVILLTGSGSHKGHRYAIARAKTYQGQRSGARRPKNWKPLRDMLEAGVFGDEVVIDYDREADDRFGQYGHAAPEKTVIGTQDKDMRMVPGFHLDWTDNRMFFLAPNVFDVQWREKQYGEKWFWMQMLHGDTADYIPGLPRAYGKQCGPETAKKMLAGVTTREQAFGVVGLAFESHYGDRWYVEMLEQACLLWMRRGETADWFDVAAIGGPLGGLVDTDRHYAAWKELTARVQQAQEINETQDD